MASVGDVQEVVRQEGGFVAITDVLEPFWVSLAHASEVCVDLRIAGLILILILVLRLRLAVLLLVACGLFLWGVSVHGWCLHCVGVREVECLLLHEGFVLFCFSGIYIRIAVLFEF